MCIKLHDKCAEMRFKSGMSNPQTDARAVSQNDVYSVRPGVVVAEGKTMRNINQHLISERLKISRSTVSRCFTNHPGINPKTRAKVFALASKMGYSHPEKRVPTGGKASSRRLAFGVLICVDLPNFEQTAYGNPGQELLNGLSEMARAGHVRLDLHFVRPEDLHLNGPSYAKIFSGRRRQWDGVVLIYPFPKTVVDELMARYPVVSLVEQYGTTPLNCVDVDHHRGMTRLVDRLHDLGHRKIGFFTWRYGVEASWALRRYSAYVERMTELGLAIDHRDVLNVGPRGGLDVEGTHARAAERTKAGVTAWVCAADHQTFDLIPYLQSQGLSVPADVSVTGFDGLASPTSLPTVTTVQIPYHQIGVIGGKRLLDLVGKRFDAAQHILLDCELRPGETIGRVRAAV
jgi:LacI family transcriptional regulator